MDDAWGHWLAGFIDGEGCFRIKPTGLGTFQCRFSIGLRADDLPILEEIRARLNVGRLYYSASDGGKFSQWRLEVNAKAECLRLVEHLDRYPLRAKKLRDYETWREAVLVWTAVQNGVRSDWTQMGALAERLRTERRAA